MLQWILGPVREVSAATAETFGYPGIEDVATLRCGFASGATATLTSVWHQVLSRPSTRRLELFCEDAMLWTEDDYLGPVHVETSAGHEEVVADPPAWIDRLHTPGGPGQVRGPVRRPEQAVPRRPGRGRCDGRRRAGDGHDRGADGGRGPGRPRGGATAAYRSAAAGGAVTAVAGVPPVTGADPARVEGPCSVREDCPMPLSEEELRILQEIEANLTATDPALVQQVSETTLYRHAARSIKWAIFGFVAGLVLLVATFTKVLVLGIVGFLVMLACLLVIERNARKLGKAGHGQPHVVVPRGIRGWLLRLGVPAHARPLAPRRHALAPARHVTGVARQAAGSSASVVARCAAPGARARRSPRPRAARRARRRPRATPGRTRPAAAG